MPNINPVIVKGDIIETPYGPGVVLEVINNAIPQSLLINVSGTDYRIKYIGNRVGHIELPN